MPERPPSGDAQRPPISDALVRDRVTADLSVTYLVEAGAGTGKTSVLVERYVACVLDTKVQGDVRRVAAITFTEKAAGELRQRVRERFEQLAAAQGGARADDSVTRALDALDDAPITTIHSFAGRLLREFPVEAGVDPAFEQLDALASELDLDRLWDEWLTALADDEAGNGGDAAAADGGAAEGADAAAAQTRAWLARLLRLGVRLSSIRELAVGSAFAERYDTDLVAPGGEPDVRAALTGLRAPLEALRAHCDGCCTDPSDLGFCAAMDLVDDCEALLQAPPRDLDLLAAALFGLKLKTGKSGPGGKKDKWTDGGKDELGRAYGELVAVVQAAREQYAAYVTDLVLAVAGRFARWAGEVQLDLGRLDFTDLLGRLRELLARDREARGALQQRFDYLLVDEFQDTDPLQAEIVLFLCEAQPVAERWTDVVLAPGKLFVVGDPKQSIYRFRRADITLYDEVKALLRRQPAGSAALEAISQNFRTTPPLVEWLNRVFEGVFAEDAAEGRQPEYQAVQAYRAPARGPQVLALAGPEYGGAAGEADAARRDEATAIAALLQRLHDGHDWQVCDRDKPGWPAEAPRPVAWRDVALLVRATTGLDTYEQALREAGVPYRVEGGKTYFARREVADALLCLRAVDDPSDGPALYGALHSSLFGFSDDDLVLFCGAGGRLDPYVAAAGQPAGHEALVEALGVLRELHERRGAGEPHELVGELVGRTRAAALLAATGPGAAQAIANLDKLVERARAFAEAGGGGLGAFLAWAQDAGDAAGEQESPGADDDDAVRILTIHKAKGLEFPVVVLAGGALGGNARGGEPIVDRRARRMALKIKAELPGSVPQELRPAAYAELAKREKLMARSEDRRVLYVALTRARDLLVVSCFGKLTTARGEASSALLGPLAEVLPGPMRRADHQAGGAAAPGADVPDARATGAQAADVQAADAPAADDAAAERLAGLAVVAPSTPRAPEPGEAPDVEALIAARAAWRDERHALLVGARRPAPATSPSGLERVDDEVLSGGEGAPPGRARALALGTAVHAVMERCELGGDESLASLAAHVCTELGRPDVAADAAELASACRRSPIVREAAASGEVHRELPVGFVLDGVLVTGAVDLLFAAADGAWVVVDYKTDRAADEATLRARYEPQGAAYALAVEAATGRSVREVVFVAAAAGLEVRVPVDDALRDVARQAAAKAAGEGRALADDELADA
jgi:ATP-dependent helicase/nuclease subunit A